MATGFSIAWSIGSNTSSMANECFPPGQHTAYSRLGIGYYGRSYVPGLVPVFPLNAADSNAQNVGDTIDPRQKDQTHTAHKLRWLHDVWKPQW